MDIITGRIGTMVIGRIIIVADILTGHTGDIGGIASIVDGAMTTTIDPSRSPLQALRSPP
jgi:hypothetical protein